MKTSKTPKAKKEKKARGRPPVITEAVVRLLQVAFENGLSVIEACQEAKISKTAYYDEREKNPAFADEMDAYQRVPDIEAKKTIVGAIKKGDTTNSRWWLEKKQRKEFGASIKHEGIPPADHRRFIIAGTKDLPWLDAKAANAQHEEKAKAKQKK